MDLREIINQENVVIVDVRETYEFQSGSAKGAINIPLSAIPQRISEFKDMGKPVVVYCRSGMRSAQAQGFLLAQGVKEVHNGGALDEVMYLQQQTV